MEILNHKVIDFDTAIRKPSEIDILNSLWDQGIDIETFNLNTKQYKRLFFNYYIKNILSTITSTDTKCFFVISDPQPSEFFDYFDNLAIKSSYRTNISRLVTIIPIIHLQDYSLSYDTIIESNEDEWVEIVSRHIIKQRDKLHSKSFKTIKRTVEYYDLKYIDKLVFDNIKTKLLF